jgi:1-deoxy-D-xylulose-5-phosphate reductoisomerase
MTRKLILLGATGSIGRSARDVIARHRDAFTVTAVVGGSDAPALAAAARETGARYAALADGAALPALREALAGSGIACGAGEGAVMEAVAYEADLVLAAIAGTAGLRPTAAAIRPGRAIALANKESLVSAGSAFMQAASRAGVAVLPVDSEHNALAQALGNGALDDVSAMTLTASGGPFRTWSREAIAAAGPQEASKHPNWSMGAKVTIDSATLMNKGLELIEAHHLFGLEAARLDVLVHPQSIVHGLVSWRDGAVTAGLAAPDMRVPIAHALAPPGMRLDTALPRLDLAAIAALSFEKPDLERFPCLGLAMAALADGGAHPTILNAANEIAVAAFIAGRLDFYGIAVSVEKVCSRMVGSEREAPDNVETALAIDERARALTREVLGM